MSPLQFSSDAGTRKAANSAPIDRDSSGPSEVREGLFSRKEDRVHAPFYVVYCFQAVREG